MASAKDIASALDALIGANDEEATVSQYLDTGLPELNNASRAGWTTGMPVGRLIEIAGPASSGKTAIATSVMAQAQKMGGIAAFMDHERSFSFSLGEGMGLNTKPGAFIYKKPRTFEESITIFQHAVTTIRDKKLIKPDAPICWVFDSLASMVPQSALINAKTGADREATERNMNDNTALARATAAHFPALSMLAAEHNVCCIFLNQIRMKIGTVFGDPRKTSGGTAPEFYFSQRLWLSAAQIKKGTEIVGMEVTGKFMKNKVSRPFMDASWRFMFQPDGSGKFDFERSTVEFLMKTGGLKKAKPGYVEFNGKIVHAEALARDIEARKAMSELLVLLPKAYEPPATAIIEGAAKEEAA